MVFGPGSKDHKSINSLLIPLFNPWNLLKVISHPDLTQPSNPTPKQQIAVFPLLLVFVMHAKMVRINRGINRELMDLWSFDPGLKTMYEKMNKI